MVRFRKYFERQVNVEKVKDTARLADFGITCRHLPDPPEDYDEFEFTTEFGRQEVLIMVTVALGKIQRILFTLTDPEDPELTRPLDESRLQEFLAQKGDRLAGFFEYITG